MKLNPAKTIITINLLILLSASASINFTYFKTIAGADKGFYNALAAPSSVVVDQMGNVYATDQGNFTDDYGNVIRIFNNYQLDYTSNLTFLSEAGVKFNFPEGIARGPDGKIYVSNTNMHRIELYSPSGAFINDFGKGGQLSSPTGIAVTPDNIYVADSGHNRVAIFSIVDRFISSTIGSGQGIGNIQFNYPQGVFYKNGKLYVADSGNGRIQVFDNSSNYLYSIGLGSGGVVLQSPVGLFVDDGEDVFVTDTITNMVYVFAPNATLISSFGNGSNSNYTFNRPRALYVQDNLLYVADTGNSRIQVFNLSVSGVAATPSEALNEINLATGEIANLRSIQNAGSMLNLSVSDNADSYLQEANSSFGKNDYEGAYANALSASNEAERVMALIKDSITKNISARLDALNSRIATDKSTIQTYKLNIQLSQYTDSLNQAHGYLDNGNYGSAISSTSEIESALYASELNIQGKVKLASDLQNALKSEITVLKANATSLSNLASQYQQQVDVNDINAQIDIASNSTSQMDFGTANMSIAKARNLLVNKTNILQAQINEIQDALDSISQAETAINRTQSEGFIIYPDLSSARTLLASAKSVAYSEPPEAKKLALSSLESANSAENMFNITRFVIIIGVIVLLLLIVSILGGGSFYLLRLGRKSGKVKKNAKNKR